MSVFVDLDDCQTTDTVIAVMNNPTATAASNRGGSHRRDTVSGAICPIINVRSSPRRALTIAAEWDANAKNILCIIGTSSTTAGTPLRTKSTLLAVAEVRRLAKTITQPKRLNRRGHTKR